MFPVLHIILILNCIAYSHTKCLFYYISYAIHYKYGFYIRKSAMNWLHFQASRFLHFIKYEEIFMRRNIIMEFSAVNTIWVLVGAALVFFMQAGFAMVETGFTRAKNAGNIIMKT